MRTLRWPLSALLITTVAPLVWPDSEASGCPLANLNEEGLHKRVETTQLLGGASVWGDHAHDVEFRLNDNDDPALAGPCHVARSGSERHLERPRSGRFATIFLLRTRVPRGPPLLLF